jgi:peroxiredoxin Q/BCP
MAEGAPAGGRTGAHLGTLRSTRALLEALATAAASRLRRDRDQPRVQLVPGDEAPDFVLPASDGQIYRLSELRTQGAVVVAWFPKAFTSGCTAQCTSMGLTARSHGGYQAAVFAASCDSVETNRAFAESTGIGVPILSDVNKTVARAYGVLGPVGLPSRWTFYIGSNGRILDIDRAVRPGGHGADIATTLERLGVSRRP